MPTNYRYRMPIIYSVLRCIGPPRAAPTPPPNEAILPTMYSCIDCTNTDFNNLLEFF